MSGAWCEWVSSLLYLFCGECKLKTAQGILKKFRETGLLPPFTESRKKILFVERRVSFEETSDASGSDDESQGNNDSCFIANPFQDSWFNKGSLIVSEVWF